MNSFDPEASEGNTGVTSLHRCSTASARENAGQEHAITLTRTSMKRRFARGDGLMPRKSYQFARARIKADISSRLKFRRLMFAAYGSVNAAEAWEDIGCSMSTLYRWLEGVVPAPI